MRLVLLIAVAALIVDALNYNGAYTQSAFRHIVVATEQLSDRFTGSEPTGSAERSSEGSADTTHL